MGIGGELFPSTELPCPAVASMHLRHCVIDITSHQSARRVNMHHAHVYLSYGTLWVPSNHNSCCRIAPIGLMSDLVTRKRARERERTGEGYVNI